MKTSKSYRQNYFLMLQVGLILSLSTFIVLFNVALTPEEESATDMYDQQEIVKMEEIIQTKQEIKAPAPPRPRVPVAVPNDEVFEEEIIDLDADLDITSALELPTTPPPPPPAAEEEKEEEIFVIVEQMPELIGGIEALQKNITYPEIAKIAGIEGRVIVKFIIDEQGRVVNPQVIRGIGGGCDEEAVKAVKKITFIPGRQRGIPVKVSYTLPVVFKIRKRS
jgi:protein TonB